jgi:hypothetical protein
VTKQKSLITITPCTMDGAWLQVFARAGFGVLAVAVLAAELRQGVGAKSFPYPVALSTAEDATG